MTAVNSTMLPLGTQAPDFSLPDTEGNLVSLGQFDGAQAYLVMFIHLGREYQEKGVAVVAINSNDVENYPADAPDKMKAEVMEAGYSFPYLYDATQEVAKRYRAACTPDFYVFDQHRMLTYRGQFDESRPGNQVPVTGSDLRAALDATLDGERIVDGLDSIIEIGLGEVRLQP